MQLADLQRRIDELWAKELELAALDQQLSQPEFELRRDLELLEIQMLRTCDTTES